MKAVDLSKALKSVTKNYSAQRKREKRNRGARLYRSQYMYSNRVYTKDAVWKLLPEVYAKVSSNGKYLAYARQLFYKIRGPVEKQTGRPLKADYFSYTLVPEFINIKQLPWRVVYDPRGHLAEPHTDASIALGTVAVDDYLARARRHHVDDFLPQAFKLEYPTKGPRHRYNGILFIEKEGFNELFKEVKLAERYDLALMSCKGQSVVAARRIVDEYCAAGGSCPVFILHDFDASGLSICQRLTSVSKAAELTNRVRYHFQNEINCVDIGLRLTDVEEWDLESEPAPFKGLPSDTIATRAEEDFLSADQRVEINAFTSEDLVAFIEKKLGEHGVKKVIPDSETLEHAYRRAYKIARVNAQMEEIEDDAACAAASATIPSDLKQQIADELEKSPHRPWDLVLAEIAANCSEKEAASEEADE